MNEQDKAGLEAIRAHHEEATCAGASQEAKTAHVDRGWLLDFITRMGKAERDAFPLVEVRTPALAVGVRVLARGRIGRIERVEDDRQRHPHPVFWVQFPEGDEIWFNPDELTPEPIAARVFEPTAEEVAACAALEEAAGKTEREAILLLGKWCQDQRATLRRLTPLLEERERALSLAEEALKKPQRPRVGPWVGRTGRSIRVDDRGQQAGSVGQIQERGDKIGQWAWFARRPFDNPAEGTAATEEEAWAAVDAVLATWADLAGSPSKEPPHTWTEAQIREAFAECVPLPKQSMIDATIGYLREVR